jgi:hypothetical protein
MGKLPISMAIFNSKLLVYQRVKYGWVWVKTLSLSTAASAQTAESGARPK